MRSSCLNYTPDTFSLTQTMDNMLSIVDAFSDFGLIRKEPVLTCGGGLVSHVIVGVCVAAGSRCREAPVGPKQREQTHGISETRSDIPSASLCRSPMSLVSHALHTDETPISFVSPQQSLVSSMLLSLSR